MRTADEIGKASAMMFKVDDCKKTCDELKKKGVRVASGPSEPPYGVEAVFVDIYGNPFV